jgi:hypothetical protein
MPNTRATARLVVSSLPLAILAAAALLAACDPAGGDADRDAGPGARCWDRGCDDFGGPPALTTIRLDAIARCTGALDVAAATDRVSCTFALPPELGATSGFARVATADGSRGESIALTTALSSGAPTTIRDYPATAYPITVDIALSFTTTEGSGSPGTVPDDLDASDEWGFSRTFATREELAAASAAGGAVVALPFDLWQVAVWPGRELGEAWAASELEGLTAMARSAFPITSAPLFVGGITASTAIDYEREVVVYRGESPTLVPLAREVITIPVLRGGEATSGATIEIDLDVFESGPTTTTAITGPGYYLLARDGSLALTAPDDLPSLVGGPTGDAGIGAPGDSGLADAGITPRVDPCRGACTADQACVAAACVARAANDQDLWSGSTDSCTAATMACDLGEDSDCAADHACVGGLCRRLACQRQALFSGATDSCTEPTAPCSADDECASGHACAAGLCRRTACQRQQLFTGTTDSCAEPAAVCDAGEDTDCATGHACVLGRCRRLACQRQQLFSGSTSSCAAATAPCEDAGDCAPDHACRESLCRRVACGG